ncbi:hypothetical protein DQ04_00471060 [Trypanosoma grayi]|uniref:hypothetical protein n=1 Tax=Trypanosoma grayi TaxID=71804 RepID=UPI0004F4A5C4|nr:hypothetical protein DQ04_00471060 [Trypanosoma grayi]KEG14432.1 hypothetical protein DQ04_00471060 [Trypanosoma grayi]
MFSNTAVCGDSSSTDSLSSSASWRGAEADSDMRRVDMSRPDMERGRQSIAAWRQTKLNNIILEETRRACVSREEHRLMLKQLLSLAYHRDPNRKANLNKWKRILLAVEKEYLGANALFTLSPDPYHQVLATLSSMMLWNAEVRHWTYEYCSDEIVHRRSRQMEILLRLQQSGKMFLGQ